MTTVDNRTIGDGKPGPVVQQLLAAWGEKVGVDISLQEGTRHSILTILGEALPERMLRAFSRHRDGRFG